MHKIRPPASLWLMIAAVLALYAGAPSYADQPPDYHGYMIVESVWATPAREGGRSILRLRIINEGFEQAHLLGVETPVATDAHIVGRISDHETTTLDSVGVSADSELDLTTDHMWIELGPLVRAVEPGDSIPLELVFLRSRLRVLAHVHSADG